MICCSVQCTYEVIHIVVLLLIRIKNSESELPESLLCAAAIRLTQSLSQFAFLLFFSPLFACFLLSLSVFFSSGLLFFYLPLFTHTAQWAYCLRTPYINTTAKKTTHLTHRQIHFDYCCMLSFLLRFHVVLWFLCPFFSRMFSTLLTFSFVHFLISKQKKNIRECDFKRRLASNEEQDDVKNYPSAM